MNTAVTSIRHDWTERALGDERLSVAARLTAAGLRHFANEHGVTTVGVDRLAKLVGLSVRAVREHLAVLVKLGFIVREQGLGRCGRGGTTARTRLLPLRGGAGEAAELSTEPLRRGAPVSVVPMSGGVRSSAPARPEPMRHSAFKPIEPMNPRAGVRAHESAPAARQGCAGAHPLERGAQAISSVLAGLAGYRYGPGAAMPERDPEAIIRGCNRLRDILAGRLSVDAGAAR